MRGLGFLPNGVASEAHDTSDNGAVVVGVSETFDAILGEAFRWTDGSGMIGLGDLPGGDSMSHANAVSSTGTTVVGVSSSEFGTEAFRWTSGNGIEGLGDLAGGTVHSVAYDVSASGNLVVGAGTTEDANTTAFMWTPDFGMRSLADVLISDYGLNSELAGWDLLAARSVSPDGRVIVGTGINPSGQIRGWFAEIDGVMALAGDINGDGQLDVGDLESIQAAIRAGDQSTQFDLNNDGRVDAGDRAYWVHDLKHTYFGDANLDGVFGSGDLVDVFVAAQYEDGVFGNSTWSTGDWNGDLEFSSSDIVLAFQDAGYERGPRAAAQAVPEPVMGSLPVLISIGALALGRLRKCV
jgi:probable HAF family extracellular repeat protein